METMQSNSLLYGANAAFVEEIYEAYLADATAVAPEWRQYFDAMQAGITHNRGTWIHVFVHPMTKTHQAIFFIFNAFHEIFNVRDIADFFQHF